MFDCTCTSCWPITFHNSMISRIDSYAKRRLQIQSPLNSFSQVRQLRFFSFFHWYIFSLLYSGVFDNSLTLIVRFIIYNLSPLHTPFAIPRIDSNIFRTVYRPTSGQVKLNGMDYQGSPIAW